MDPTAIIQIRGATAVSEIKRYDCHRIQLARSEQKENAYSSARLNWFQAVAAVVACCAHWTASPALAAASIDGTIDSNHVTVAFDQSGMALFGLEVERS